MRHATSLLLAAMTCALAVTLVVQYRTTQGLRLAIPRAKQLSEARARLWAENQALRAHQASEGELQQLRADHAALPRLTSEIESVTRQAAELKPPPAEPPPALAPAAEWKVLGLGTPTAAVETLMWASAHGDVGTLAKGIALDTASQAAADALWERLPAAERAKYGSAADLIATMVARDGATVAYMGILGQRLIDPNTVVVTARVENAGHEGKTENFELRQSDGAWRLAIPPRALDRYATAIAAQQEVR